MSDIQVYEFNSKMIDTHKLSPIIQMFQGDENQYYFCTENVEMELKQKDKKACDIPVGPNKYMASEK